MSYENLAPPQEPRQVFELDRPPALIIWLAIVLVSALLLSIVELRSGAYFGALLFALGFAFFLLMSAISAASLSDIAIDNVGISRIALGRTWRMIRWEDISVIKVFDSPDRSSSKTIRAFNIYPTIRPRFSLSGKIVFGERMERPKVFIELLNKYIVEYSIKIESTEGGVCASPYRLGPSR